MTRHESLFAEIVYNLSYLAGEDELHRFIEDSRDIFMLIKDWAEEFDVKYPMPRNVVCDFSEIYKIDYLIAIDKFYIEKRNEYMRNVCDVNNVEVFNTLFKNKC